MEFYEYILFISIAFAQTASPGPSTLLAVINGLQYGPFKALYAVIGHNIALVILSLISILGLSAILLASGTIFSIVKLCGAAYLLYLGIKSFRSVGKEGFSFDSETKTGLSKIQLFNQGFLVGITNPKAIIFFTAFFPLFIDTKVPLMPQYIALMALFCLISIFSLMLWAYLSNRIKPWLSKPEIFKWFKKATGGVFVLFGVLLGISSRN